MFFRNLCPLFGVQIMALGVGLEPTTARLTVESSTIELPQNVINNSLYNNKNH